MTPEGYKAAKDSVNAYESLASRIGSVDRMLELLEWKTSGGGNLEVVVRKVGYSGIEVSTHITGEFNDRVLKELYAAASEFKGYLITEQYGIKL